LQRFRIQGLFRRESDPMATGQSFPAAFWNQRITSSVVSTLVIGIGAQ
jgi:hypothetical protein